MNHVFKRENGLMKLSLLFRMAPYQTNKKAVHFRIADTDINNNNIFGTPCCQPIVGPYPCVSRISTKKHNIYVYFCMTYTQLTEKDILDLLYQFESCTLPKSAWTHEAHLIVAIAYNQLYGKTAALERARKNIRRYNEAVGTLNTEHSGYHETITRFWIWLADCFLQMQENKSLAAACNAFIRSRYIDKELPLRYYSRGLLFSVEARTAGVQPDVSPFEIAALAAEN